MLLSILLTNYLTYAIMKLTNKKVRGTKMYCKNCGKYLEEGTRFCDRCGQSVRKNANSEQAVRHQNIEELKEERLNRKKRLAEMEAREAMKNKRKQKRRKQNQRFAAFMIIVVILAIVSVVAAYRFMRSSSNITEGGNAAETQAPQSTQTTGGAVSNQTQSSQNPQSTQDTSAVNSGDYRVFEINNVMCPYPADFSKKAVSGNEKLSIVDSAGGGIMLISQEQNVNKTPAELMKDYASTIGVSPSYSLADKNSYAITTEKNNEIYHRKCIVSGNTAIYYDFQYSAMSSSRARYEQCVAYIDSNMKTK